MIAYLATLRSPPETPASLCIVPQDVGFETITITLAEVETLWGESCGDVATLCRSEPNVFDEIRADLAAEGVRIDAADWLLTENDL